MKLWDRAATFTLPKSGQSYALRDYPFHRALAELFLHEAYGSLTLDNQGLEKRILFRAGMPVYIESNIPEETLERFLSRRQLVDDASLYRAQTEAYNSGRHLGEVLVGMELLDPRSLFTAMRRNLGACVLTAFHWSEGTLRFDEGDPDVDSKVLLKVQTEALVLRGICDHAPLAAIQADFQDFDAASFCVRPGAFAALTAFNLQPNEMQLAQALTVPRNISQVAEVTASDQETVLRFVYALALLGVLTPADATQPYDALPVVPLPASETRQTAAVDIAREGPFSEPDPFLPHPSSTMRAPLLDSIAALIDRAYLLAKSDSYYVLLGVSPSATVNEIRQAYLVRTETFSPVAYRDYDLSELAERLEELFVTLARAFVVLSDKHLRQLYDQRLADAARQRLQRQHAKPEAEVKLDLPLAPPQAPMVRPIEEEETTPSRLPRPVQTKKATQSLLNVPVTEARSDSGESRLDALYVIDSTAIQPSPALFEAASPLGETNARRPTIPSVSSYLDSGSKLLQSHRAREATSHFMAAVNLEPHNALAWAHLGYASYLADPSTNFNEALTHLQRAVDLEPASGLAHFYTGRVYEMARERGSALLAYEECLRHDPEHKSAQAAVKRLRHLLYQE